MHIFKKLRSGTKHLLILFGLGWLCNLVKSAQIRLLKLFFRKGITRKIGDIDKVHLCSDCLDSVVPKVWEVGWWKKLTQQIRPQDTIVDVGAYVGVFTIIMAKRTGVTGKVLAFEPNPQSVALLKKNIELNGVSGQVEFFNIAVGKDHDSHTLVNHGDISCIVPSAPPGCTDYLTVKSGTLDEMLQNRKIDIIKIDVEGYEANVLYGARNLLSKKEGNPRFIWIECHPHVWKKLGTSSKDILTPLKEAGYTIEMPKLPENKELEDLNHHWVIFAAKTDPLRA